MQKGIFFLLLLVLSSCHPRQWQIQQASSTKIAIDASTQLIADTSYINFLQPYKKQVDEQMNVVIGRAAETMRGHAPESLLSNLSADIYRRAASDYLKSEVDIAIVNLGGLRTTVPAGNITIGKVFELMPFENELVILYLSGENLNTLCQYFASMGGEGVSGLRFKIVDKKAIDIQIKGEVLDIKRIYSIATNDYLAGGNDKMEILKKHVKRTNTSIKVRNMLLDYIKAETAKGNEIKAELDGRIVISL